MSLIATFDVSFSEEEEEAPTTTTMTPDDDRGRGGNAPNKLRHSLYLGGKAAAKDYETLCRWKITHIVNMTPPKQTNIDAGVPNYFEKAASTKLGKRIRYLRIPIYDTAIAVRELVTEHYEQHIVHFITKGLCHGNVLVHCARGVSRSTMAVLLYLMTKRNLRYDAALALIRQRRPQAQPIPAFATFLQQREAQLFGLKLSSHDVTAGEDNSKKDDEEEEGTHTNPKKRQRTITTTNTTPTPGNNVVPEPIGPTVPASLVTTSRTTMTRTKRPKIRTAPRGPATVVRGVVVGPELPPTSSSSSSSSRHHGTTTTAPTRTGRRIGPALPPSSSPPQSKTIGPALPPGRLE